MQGKMSDEAVKQAGAAMQALCEQCAHRGGVPSEQGAVGAEEISILYMDSRLGSRRRWPRAIRFTSCDVKLLLRHLHHLFVSHPPRP